MRGRLRIIRHILSVVSSAGVLVLFLALIQGTNRILGALRRCDKNYIYCETTDSCELLFNCDSEYCNGRQGDISCDGGATCYSLRFDRCDDFRKCRDGADEFACITRGYPSCSRSQMSCDNGQKCYSSSDKCDNYKDCDDGADEANCCSAHQTKCRDNSGCYSESSRCDNVNDCLDGSDETNCDWGTGENTPGVFSDVGIIVGIVVAAIVLSACMGAIACYFRKRRSTPSFNTANYFVPRPASMATSDQLLQTNTSISGQTTTDPCNFYYSPQHSSHNTRQPLVGANTGHQGAQYPGYREGGYQPVRQPTAPSATDISISLPETGADYPPPSAPSMYRPAPPITDTAPPPSYEDLFIDK